MCINVRKVELNWCNWNRKKAASYFVMIIMIIDTFRSMTSLRNRVDIGQLATTDLTLRIS